MEFFCTCLSLEDRKKGETSVIVQELSTREVIKLPYKATETLYKGAIIDLYISKEGHFLAQLAKNNRINK